MITIDEVRKLALSFEEAIELPHFELTSFRVRKKIFLTLDEKQNRACLMFTPIEQSLFVDGDAVYPVPGGWGAKGATYIDLAKVRKSVFKDGLKTAYCLKAPKSLAEKYK